MKSGTSHKDMRAHNRGLVLKQIATGRGASRIEIAKASGLTKTAITNVVNELVASGVVCEGPAPAEPGGFGRPPVRLSIAASAPLIGGVLLRRGTLAVVLGTLAGQVVDSETLRFEGPIAPEAVQDHIVQGFAALRNRRPGPLLAVGAAAPGLVDNKTGEVLDPPGLFSRPSRLPLVAFLQERVHPRAYLMHDSTACALAEKLYGPPHTLGDSFAFVSLVNGIGAGLYLGGRIYDGAAGQAGELGHMPLALEGPPCHCGGHGCLEQFASLQAMTAFLRRRLPLVPGHPLAGAPAPAFGAIVHLAGEGDTLCRMALLEYARALAAGLAGLVNLLNVDVLVVHHEGESPVLRDMIRQELDARLAPARRGTVPVIPPRLGQAAPLAGTLAIVSDRVFEGDLPPV